MKTVTARDIILGILRLAVGAVLLYAGFRKAVAPSAEFAAAIDAYHLLPYRAIVPLAAALPWIEMWTGTFLIAGYFLRYSAIVSSVLFAVFLAALGSTLARGLDLASCGCFGAEALNPKQTIGLDAVLLVFSLTLAVAARAPRAWTVDAWLEKS